MHRFPARHRIADRAELLFFLGFAGENAHYGFDVHEANGSGYCTQEVANSGDDDIFELFWQPQVIQATNGTAAEARRAAIKWDNPAGFSGSPAWNTRYLEVGGDRWRPEDAVVTGLLRRWDPETKTLLVWRVQHLLAWLQARAG
jgi:hypothetical protein